MSTMILLPVAVKWTVRYYSSSGAKYKISLVYSGCDDRGACVLPATLPVSIQDKGENIKATFADMTVTVFTGINELAEHFKSHVTDFDSVKD